MLAIHNVLINGYDKSVILIPYIVTFRVFHLFSKGEVLYCTYVFNASRVSAIAKLCVIA